MYFVNPRVTKSVLRSSTYNNENQDKRFGLYTGRVKIDFIKVASVLLNQKLAIILPFVGHFKLLSLSRLVDNVDLLK